MGIFIFIAIENSLDQLCLYGLKDIKKKSNVVKNIYLHDSYSSISLKQDLHFSASNKKEALAYIIDGNTLSSDINKKLKSLRKTSEILEISKSTI